MDASVRLVLKLFLLFLHFKAPTAAHLVLAPSPRLCLMAIPAARSGRAGSGGPSAAGGSAKLPASGGNGPCFPLHCWNAGIDSDALHSVGPYHVHRSAEVMLDLAQRTKALFISGWGSHRRGGPCLATAIKQGCPDTTAPVPLRRVQCQRWWNNIVATLW